MEPRSKAQEVGSFGAQGRCRSWKL